MAERATTTLNVEGMTCMHCAGAVQRALEGVTGVIDAEVDLAHKKATVTYDPSQAGTEQFKAAVVEAGYQTV